MNQHDCMRIHRAFSFEQLPRIAHGFFGRAGGVSTGLYASLNCGPGSRDASAAVAENRARAVAAIAPGARLVSLAQIHSANVHIVGPDWDFAARPEGDGIATALPADPPSGPFRIDLMSSTPWGTPQAWNEASTRQPSSPHRPRH